MDLWQDLLRPLAFTIDSERIHTAAVKLAGPATPLLGFASTALQVRHPRLRVRALGLTFENPVGLAAGFDKDGSFARFAAGLGFGLHTLGTATPVGQQGNPKPRMFRMADEQGLVNRMGFNNPGVEPVARRLDEAVQALPHFPFGFSIGKNKATPAKAARDDYRKAYAAVRTRARFIEVNVSSPNTEGLRDLQTGAFLGRVLETLREVDERAGDGIAPPILLKIAPDLNEDALAAVAELGQTGRAQGIIATNTVPYDGPSDSGPASGGLSGLPIRQAALEQLRTLRRLTGPDVTLVAAGGIATGEDAWERIRAGASLVQLYTALVYRGPLVAAQINRELLACLDRDGFGELSDGVGVDAAP